MFPDSNCSAFLRFAIQSPSVVMEDTVPGVFRTFNSLSPIVEMTFAFSPGRTRLRFRLRVAYAFWIMAWLADRLWIYPRYIKESTNEPN